VNTPPKLALNESIPDLMPHASREGVFRGVRCNDPSLPPNVADLEKLGSLTWYEDIKGTWMEYQATPCSSLLERHREAVRRHLYKIVTYLAGLGIDVERAVQQDLETFRYAHAEKVRERHEADPNLGYGKRLRELAAGATVDLGNLPPVEAAELIGCADREIQDGSYQASPFPAVERFVEQIKEQRRVYWLARGTHSECKGCGAVRLTERMTGKSGRKFCDRGCMASQL
jgi:hypothetical protein